MLPSACEGRVVTRVLFAWVLLFLAAANAVAATDGERRDIEGRVERRLAADGDAGVVSGVGRRRS